MPFKIGDIVQVNNAKWIGTVVQFDDKQDKYLVRQSTIQQMYFSEDEITLFN